MEDFSKLLLEERAHSEQFKANFLQLRSEFDKLVQENRKLNEEIERQRLQKPEEPNEVLKRTLKNAEKELQGKDTLILSLQEKLNLFNVALKQKAQQEEFYVHRMNTTEIALEETKSLLTRLEVEASALARNLQEARDKEEHQHQRDLLDLAGKYAQSEKDKKNMAHQVIRATSKAQNKLNLLGQENTILAAAISKLKENLDKVNWEKSELSSQLETQKVQWAQERGELLMQIRNLECETTKLEGKVQTLEVSARECARDREKNALALQAVQSELQKSRANLYELQVERDQLGEKASKQLNAQEQRHRIELDELYKTIQGLRVNLSEESAKTQRHADKLREHEKQLVSAEELLRKEQVEVGGRVQEVRVETENKYRAVLEEKFKAEIEVERRCAQLESQLILERNLKASLETATGKLVAENQALSEKLLSLRNSNLDVQQLQLALELKEKEKVLVGDELDHCKQKLDSVLKNKEQNEEKMLQSAAALREQLNERQAKIDQLQSEFKALEQKSRQYSKLIWKLRQRLTASKNQ